MAGRFILTETLTHISWINLYSLRPHSLQLNQKRHLRSPRRRSLNNLILFGTLTLTLLHRYNFHFFHIIHPQWLMQMQMETDGKLRHNCRGSNFHRDNNFLLQYSQLRHNDCLHFHNSHLRHNCLHSNHHHQDRNGNRCGYRHQYNNRGYRYHNDRGHRHHNDRGHRHHNNRGNRHNNRGNRNSNRYRHSQMLRNGRSTST